MTVADYAFIISVLSIIVSLFNVVWNVWQKFIFLKPVLQISFGLWHVMEHTTADVLSRSGHRLLVLTVTNMGPGIVILCACIGKPEAHWWTRGKLLDMLNPIHNDPADPNPTSIGPFSAGLPTKIDAGDVKSFYFPYAKDCFLREGLVRVGINDTYHRNTWCPGRDIRKAMRAYHRDFG
jgi:hypothetical protein